MDGTRKEVARWVHAKVPIRFHLVLRGSGSEFQTHSAAGNQMFDDGFGPARSFRNKKIKLGAHAHGPRNWRGQK